MNIHQLKGFIAEEIAKYHMLKLEYEVVPIGREKIEPELSNLLLYLRGNMGHVNSLSQNSFNLFENTISKLPDFAVWKVDTSNAANKMTFRFLEVKYRSVVKKLKKHKSEDKYSLNISIKDDGNELLIHKYIKNLTNLYGIASQDSDTNINNIEFYIYLITILDNKYVPMIGKVQTSGYSDYFTYLYTPKQLEKEENLLKLWGKDYKKISDFFMNKNKIDYLFSDDFIIPLLDKDDVTISSEVVTYLDGMSY